MFVIFSGQHDDHRMDGIFSTREKAESAVVELKKFREHCEIRDVEVDELVGKKAVPHWRATVDVKTGQLLRDKNDGSYCWYEGMYHEWEDVDYLDFDTYEWAIQMIPYQHSGYTPRQFSVLSRKSKEAAEELALAAWAELSRRLDLSKLFELTGSLWYPRELAEKLYADGICRFRIR